MILTVPSGAISVATMGCPVLRAALIARRMAASVKWRRLVTAHIPRRSRSQANPLCGTTRHEGDGLQSGGEAVLPVQSRRPQWCRKQRASRAHQAAGLLVDVENDRIVQFSH